MSPEPEGGGPRTVGLDLGATLAKLALGGLEEVARLPSEDLGGIRARIESWSPDRLAATGGGASSLGETFAGLPVEHVGEFEAWAAGAPRVAAHAGLELPERYLLVSVGTGTSVLAVEGETAERVGGTALGGGTLLGLGRLLVGTEGFTAIAELASRGDRRAVDLLVGDVYPHGVDELAAQLNAASFGKLHSTAPEDLAHALAGMIGENVALIAVGLAHARGIEEILYCGSTLEGTAPLTQALTLATELFGGHARFLPQGAYCGAVGAAALLD